MQQEKGIPWEILGSACLLAFTMYGPQFCVPPMEYILKEELLLTHAQTSLLFNLPLVMMVALAIPGGILADRIGIRKAAGIGAILIAVGATLRGITTDFPVLLALTSIYGGGIAFVFPNLPRLVSIWAPREKVGLATGAYTTAFVAGTAVPVTITLPLIFPITNTFQGTFFIWGIPSIVAAIVWWTLAREHPDSGSQDEPLSGGNITFRQILVNKNLWLVGILFMLSSFFFNNWAAWGPALMMERGALPETAALIASLAIWVGIPAVLLPPHFSDKLGLRKPFLWIPCIILAFTSWWAMNVTVPLGWLLMALAGVAHHTRMVTTLMLPIEMFPKEAVGRASGMIFTLGFAGGTIGAFIGGYILDLTGSLDLALLFLIGTSIAAAAIAFQIPETGLRANIKK